VLAQAIVAAMAALGLRARQALFASSLLGTYVLLCDRLQFHNNRWALACYALLFSLTPCDRRDPREGPLWAARLAQVQVTLIYLASGGSKLLDADWRSGRVILERFAMYGYQAVDAGVPRAVIDRLSEPTSARALATLAIATELLLVVGLWPRRTRAFALWWGVWFHLTIEATSRVESFTWLTLAMYALFATPDARARRIVYDPSSPRTRARDRAAGLARAIRSAAAVAPGRRSGPRRRGPRREAGDQPPRPRRGRAVHAAALPALDPARTRGSDLATHEPAGGRVNSYDLCHSPRWTTGSCSARSRSRSRLPTWIEIGA
jgi:hypothetical protein